MRGAQGSSFRTLSGKIKGQRIIKKIIPTLALLLIFQHIIYAEALAPEIGTIKEFSSSNKTFSIDIKILGYPDNSPCEGTFKVDGQILWTKQFSTTPGFVDISDNGNYFVFANWGWYDEAGYKSISFYNGDGTLLKTIQFGSGKEGMRWLEKTCISRDGNYYIATNGFKNNSQVTLYFVPKQTVIWNKNIGMEQIDNININQTGEYILISTFDYQEHNIHFSYLNKADNILWEKKINNGHSWNKDFIWLSEDGMTFKVFDLNQNIWQHYENKKGKITLKK